MTVLVPLPKSLHRGDEINVTIGYTAAFNSNASGKKCLSS